MGFPSCRAEQLHQGKKFQEKEHKGETNIRKLFRKNPKKKVVY